MARNAKELFDITGKVVIITGGAGLLGSVYSNALAEAGANVIVVDVDKAKGEALTNEIKKKTKNNDMMFQKCDITKENEIKDLISAVLKRFGRIDALVNNAYPRNKNFGRKFEDVTYEDFCENVDMHLGGYFLVAKEVSKVMMKQKSGSIINKASIYGFSAPRFEIYEGTEKTMPVEYAAIKGGIINLTRYLASYLGKYNIRVNSISPGGIFDSHDPKFVANYSRKVALGKGMLDRNDVTGTLLFLLSDASEKITGQNIVVDAGWSL